MFEYLFAFVVGGAVTTSIVYFEASGLPLLSRLAALFPVFTWLSYLFIGRLDGSQAVSRHAWFVLIGTIVAWLPYMAVIALLAPRVGPTKAVLAGIVVFLVLATLFAYFYKN
ncbi:MAG: hypothetical protein HYR90_00810 [Candidatus Andersenbacteria bacterium]|nr:hypothetical protein [Candidatus Andersenbacteria bacterium]MBI3251211.1 hypothetical protein [Candidatus Andersenbacteria bacterium]